MKRQSIFGVMVMAVAMISAMGVSATAAYAMPLSANTGGNAVTPSGKMVKFTLRNDSKEPMKVMAGDTEMTLKPGVTVNVKLAAGQTIVAEETTASNKAGAVLATVMPELGGATIAIR